MLLLQSPGGGNKTDNQAAPPTVVGGPPSLVLADPMPGFLPTQVSYKQVRVISSIALKFQKIDVLTLKKPKFQKIQNEF